MAQSNAKIVACYVRVSTVGQNEAGQRAELDRWLTGNGLNPANVRWFIDKRTGDNLNRPGFAKLQAAIFAGEIGTVCVYKLDRLSRSLRDGINTICDWCDKGLRLVAVTEQIDFNGPVGKMLAAVLLGIDEMEQETRRERQRAGIDVAKKQGKYKGRKPGTTKAKPARPNVKGAGAVGRRNRRCARRVAQRRVSILARGCGLALIVPFGRRQYR